MAMVFFDGFDHYSDIGSISGRKWDVGSSANLSSTPGRYEGFSGTITTTGIYKTLPASNTWIIGGAILQFDYGGTLPFFSLIDKAAGMSQVDAYQVPTTGAIYFQSGSTLLGTSTFIPPIGLWYYIEFNIVIGGLLECRVNEAVILSIPTAATNLSGSGIASQIRWTSRSAANGNEYNLDDFYCANASGSVNNTYLGDSRVQTRYPSSAGFVDEFTPASGPNTSANRVAQVNVPVTNFVETGLYNYDGNVGDIDLYNIGTFTVAGQIFAVQSNLVFRKDDVGNRGTEHVMRTAGTNYFSTPEDPCYSSYTMSTKLWENDPSTSSPWTLSEINSTQFGITVSS